MRRGVPSVFGVAVQKVSVAEEALERSGEREGREGGGGRKRRKGQRRRRPRLDVHTNAESLLCEVSGPFCNR